MTISRPEASSGSSVVVGAAMKKGILHSHSPASLLGGGPLLTPGQALGRLCRSLQVHALQVAHSTDRTC